MKKSVLFALANVIVINFAFSQGTAINTNGAAADQSAILDLSSASKGLRIPRVGLTDTSSSVTPIINPANGLLVFDTLTGAPGSGITPGFYYWNGAKTQWTPLAAGDCSYTVGQSYGGGKIFYIDASGCHGLISATADQSTGIAWSNITSGYSGALAYSNGFANTAGIVAQGATSGAAYMCDTLSLNGYTDWFLPSRDEMTMMFMKRAAIGGFATTYYWNSTEASSANGSLQSFSTGGMSSDSKSANYRVRAIRRF